MKNTAIFAFSFVLALLMISTASAQCNFGDKTATTFCDINGVMQLLKATGAPCENDFECKTLKCLEGNCSLGVASAVAQQTDVLNAILNLFQQPLPIGVKNITANVPVTFSYSASIYETKIETSNNVQAGVFVSTIGTSAPLNVTEAPGKIFKYTDVSVYPDSARSKVSSATIKFKVEKTWFADNNCNASTTILQRYIGDEKKWVPLTTRLVNETSTAYLYEAKSSGFSTFAITASVNSAPIATCGNGNCSSGESPLTCCIDCGCPSGSGKICANNTCVLPGQSSASCSDGIKNQGLTESHKVLDIAEIIYDSLE